MSEQLKSTKSVLYLCVLVFILIIPLLSVFLWNEKFDSNLKIDSGKFGTFGDFFGGVFGSIWSLAGVFLFYLALKEQRSDFANNKTALIKQIEALEVQTDEFKLQREELRQTRSVFIEQSTILKQQRFESTFFSLLELFLRIASELNGRSEVGDFFGEIKTRMNEESCVIPSSDRSSIRNHYVNYFREIINQKSQSSTHYFKLFYRILKLIDDSNIDQHDKFLYMKIFRSQLTVQSLLITYYNSYCPESRALYKLILKYNLLKHLPKQEKLEFKNLVSRCDNLGALENFNSTIDNYLVDFISILNDMLRSDDFDCHSISFGYESLTIRIESDDDIVLDFYVSIDSDSSEKILGFSKNDFYDYFSAFIYDVFVSSQYINDSEIDIKSKIMNDFLKIEIRSRRPLRITTDKV